MSESSQTPRFTTPFLWDSVAMWGTITDDMSLTELLEAVPNALDGRQVPPERRSGAIPKFGFRQECSSPRTLRDFLEGR